jgi:hypothetical protein
LDKNVFTVILGLQAMPMQSRLMHSSAVWLLDSIVAIEEQGPLVQLRSRLWSAQSATAGVGTTFLTDTQRQKLTTTICTIHQYYLVGQIVENHM